MKSTAINTLEYTGIVTLSQYIKSKKIKLAQMHNTGGYSLFNFLTDCLIGNFDVANINRPTKIMLLNQLEDDKDEYEDVSGFIYLRAKPEKNINNGTAESSVTYSFLVSSDILRAKKFTHIALYSDYAKREDIKNFAAMCKVETSAASISMASALIVDWKLIISNHVNSTPQGGNLNV